MAFRLALLAGTLILAGTACTQDLYKTGRSPHGLSQRDVERDYMECEYKARMANDQHFFNQRSPFPGPQSPADHARALHGISTIQAMRDSCLAAKGYRVE